GSQKALSLSPGIAIVVMDTKAIERMNGIKPASYYFDIRVHLSNQVRGQTPFTPAVGTLLELNDMLCMIEADGLEARLERSKTLAEYFRDGARALGLKVPDYPLSNAVTPLVFEDGAYALFETLKEKYDILVTPSGGDLRNRLLRVGHIGNLGKEDYDALLSAMKEVLQ
ncbi:MAG: alanine--glyoxylate aminotransferase family protein, partial [archaeon]|nr:alanine--glyoxylate aminotransferase family protein [archaeon]